MKSGRKYSPRIINNKIQIYVHFQLQLTVTFGVICIFVFHEPTKQWARQNSWLWWVAFIIMLVTMISMACCESVRRKTPTNYIFLGIFTLTMSFMLGLVTSTYRANEVLMAVGITAVVCLALTLFAFQTKWDFTVMGGVLTVAVVILFLFGILCIFFRSQTMSLIYASLGALVFCVYLVYDTQLMMGGKHKYSISPEEYVFAALNLYMDIINIFMYILAILGNTRD